jgi:hypothetical protein
MNVASLPVRVGRCQVDWRHSGRRLDEASTRGPALITASCTWPEDQSGDTERREIAVGSTVREPPVQRVGHPAITAER